MKKIFFPGDKCRVETSTTGGVSLNGDLFSGDSSRHWYRKPTPKWVRTALEKGLCVIIEGAQIKEDGYVVLRGKTVRPKETVERKTWIHVQENWDSQKWEAIQTTEVIKTLVCEDQKRTGEVDTWDEVIDEIPFRETIITRKGEHYRDKLVRSEIKKISENEIRFSLITIRQGVVEEIRTGFYAIYRDGKWSWGEDQQRREIILSEDEPESTDCMIPVREMRITEKLSDPMKPGSPIGTPRGAKIDSPEEGCYRIKTVFYSAISCETGENLDWTETEKVPC